LPSSDRDLQHLFDNNRRWARTITARDPGFFETLSQQQSPRYLWIGCSDSRVPANEIVGLRPGELFVHRNVANVVVHTDLNCLSVLQYAVDVLRVEHVVVCGHYGCGGIQAAYRRDSLGLIDNWLRHVQDVHDRYVQDVHDRYASTIDAGTDAASRLDRLCELNVIEQARHTCQTTVVRDAWSRGQSLAVHSWIYSLDDGLLRDLGFTVSSPDEVAASHLRVTSTSTGPS
jgi:carbonic anhydrase